MLLHDVTVFVFTFCVSDSSRSGVRHESPRWRSAVDAQTQMDSEEATDVLTSTPLKQSYVRFIWKYLLSGSPSVCLS